MIGMNCMLMRQYIEFVADRLLGELGNYKVILHKSKDRMMVEGTLKYTYFLSLGLQC